MTPEQREAIITARAALTLMPPPGARVSPEIADAWLTALRAAFQKIADAFPEEPDEEGRQP